MRVAYLGPPGTFTQDALREAAGDDQISEAPAASVYDAILAVSSGEADRALVPFENSIEGAVRSTLDTLAFDASGVAIIGEHDFAIRHCLVAHRELPLAEITLVLSHPQASAQCARFIRENLPRAEVQGAASTADAVRQVSESSKPWAALGAAGAASRYDCVVLRDGVEDEPDNVTRFVWVAPESDAPSPGSARARGGVGETSPGATEGPWRTSLVFSELGEDHPGALVDALQEFSSREVNLTRIESRPLRRGLGRYMFFCDLEGASDDATVAEAIDGLRGKAESVRVLGSYPIGEERGVPG